MLCERQRVHTCGPIQRTRPVSETKNIKGLSHGQPGSNFWLSARAFWLSSHWKVSFWLTIYGCPSDNCSIISGCPPPVSQPTGQLLFWTLHSTLYNKNYERKRNIYLPCFPRANADSTSMSESLDVKESASTSLHEGRNVTIHYFFLINLILTYTKPSLQNVYFWQHFILGPSGWESTNYIFVWWFGFFHHNCSYIMYCSKAKESIFDIIFAKNADLLREYQKPLFRPKKTTLKKLWDM